VMASKGSEESDIVRSIEFLQSVEVIDAGTAPAAETVKY